MNNLRNLAIAAALLFAVGVSDARAGLITLVNGPVALQTPAAGTNPNDVIPGLWGYIGADIALTGVAGTSYLVTFTLVGSESGYTNTLVTPGGSITENNGITAPFVLAVQPSVSYIQVATGGNDLLDFKFTTPGLFDLANGSNGGFTIGDPRTFYASFCSVGTPIVIPVGGCNFSGNATTGDAAWLSLDDSGAGPDDNHDDWVGYITVTPVTVPDGGSALALLGAALTGLGMLRRRLS
jgi:hypothetical protein